MSLSKHFVCVHDSNKFFLECILGWSLNEKERSLYKILYVKGNRTSAEQWCSSLEGELATVENADENAYIYSLLDTNLEIYKEEAQYWIANEANSTQFKDWGTQEPGEHNCIALTREDNMWKWKTVPCTSTWKR